MFTLDEVIKMIEDTWVCPSVDEANEYCEMMVARDAALQYLKWYKELADDSEAYAEWKENQPLTWDELRTMEGKPVWVEQCNGDTKGWLLILRTNFDVINCTTKHGNSFYLYKSSYGERWQAYRKERTE